MDHRTDSPNQVNEHAWGHSIHLYHNSCSYLARAHGLVGGASSLHFHAGKANAFIVVEGKIELWDEEDDLIAAVNAGESYTVAAGRQHRMVFVTDAVLYELYTGQGDPYQPIDIGDIIRTAPDWKPGDREVEAKS